MSGTIIKSARNTPNAPQDLGPYTQSVAFSHYNNIAAQLPPRCQNSCRLI